MITKTATKDKNLFIYEFTEGHIYNYVKYFVNVQDEIELLHLFIHYYDNENKKNAVKFLMKDIKNADKIFDGVEKMKNNKSVICTLSTLCNKYESSPIYCIDYMFQNQNHINIVPYYHPTNNIYDHIEGYLHYHCNNDDDY